MSRARSWGKWRNYIRRDGEEDPNGLGKDDGGVINKRTEKGKEGKGKRIFERSTQHSIRRQFASIPGIGGDTPWPILVGVGPWAWARKNGGARSQRLSLVFFGLFFLLSREFWTRDLPRKQSRDERGWENSEHCKARGKWRERDSGLIIGYKGRQSGETGSGDWRLETGEGKADRKRH
ncbi:hypothetical protein BP00DRAFT_1798 [Aspergillus indologenus CBS 114.80]|uniref:Uncharacterized protein n=1 Tax=Aspergillus indologenus CBS 114.80 TaxID=1450541 RepID=A0A2V5IMW5_9EURO|nr:hypothetical protein BP00DRAFT_1798 [Aspergillus indologenus CBS 114.80]